MDRQPRKRIGVFEPQPEAAAFLYFSLRGHGYDPHVITRADELHKLAAGGFDLVVLETVKHNGHGADQADMMGGLALKAPVALINTVSPGMHEGMAGRADLFLDFPTRLDDLLLGIDKLIGPPSEPDDEVQELVFKRLRMPRILMTAHSLGAGGRAVFRGELAIKGLHFTEGMVTSAWSDQVSDRLGNMLIAEGRLDESALHAAVLESERTGRRIGEVMVKRGLLSGEDLVRSLQEHFAQIAYSLFGWTSCSFTFDPIARDTQAGCRLLRTPASLTLFGVFLEYDEGRLDAELPRGDVYLIPNRDAPFRLVDLSLSRDQLLLISQIDGGSTLAELAAQAPCDPHQAKALLLTLIVARMVLVAGRPADRSRYFISEAQGVLPAERFAGSVSRGGSSSEQAASEAEDFAKFAKNPKVS